MATSPTAEKNEHILFDQDVETIAIERIAVTALNPRLAEAERDDEIKALAGDMAVNGLLQPIGVVQGAGDEYRLVWGSRRLEAARRLGWSTIQAAVLPSSVDAAQIAAAENLHRRAMNPLEEALAVEHLLERHKDLAPADAQRRVGEALGRSATWVRDRMFLARLGPIARAKVLDGTLPLAYARLLAKVVDPRTQADLLSRWCTCDGTIYRHIEDANNDVNTCALSLHQVPWSLEADGVGKGCPACTGCPSNSANATQAGLFEHDNGSPLGPSYTTQDPLGRNGHQDGNPGPFCLDRPCFERKVAAVRAAVKAAEKKASRAPTKETRSEAFVAAAPAWVEPKAFKAMLPEPVAPTKSAAKSVAKPISAEDSERKWRERQRKAEAERKRQAAEAKLVTAAIGATPGAKAVLLLLSNGAGYAAFGKAGSHKQGVRDKAEVPKAIRDLVSELKSGTLSLARLDELVAKDWEGSVHSPWDELTEMIGKPTVAFLATAFGVDKVLKASEPSVPAGTARTVARGRKDASTVPGRKSKKPAKKGGRK